MKKIKLVLENGETFYGESIGSDIHQIVQQNKDEILGEVVFNTGMTGYQEVFSDPSYCDQIVVMTYPLIGNYGTSPSSLETLNPSLKAIVVREISQTSHHWNSQAPLSHFLKQHSIVGITGIDTRKLTKIIRSEGSMKGVILASESKDAYVMLQKTLPMNQIEKVSVKSPAYYPATAEDSCRVVMIDFGYKKNILKSLLKRGCEVIIVPYKTNLSDIKNFNPDGILLSNGPGDPKSIPEVLPIIKELQNQFPLFAICMGHQLFALANGADTEKMKFGHRGLNHPIKDLEKDRVYITSQNHGFTVCPDSIQNTLLTVTQTNLNDQSIEGLRHKTCNAFSVQYHPEASPGPSDTDYLFNEFVFCMKKTKKIFYSSQYKREATCL